jgi:hypothetical protein
MQSPSHLYFFFLSYVEGKQCQVASPDSGTHEIAGNILTPQFIRRKRKQSQHSQTSLVTAPMKPLLLSSSIHIMYNLFVFLQLLASFTGGRASHCTSVAYIEVAFSSQVISLSSTHPIFCIEQV